MTRTIVGRRTLQIWITVQERDVLEALLILHSYSCYEYSVVAGRPQLELRDGMNAEPPSPGSATAGISARCDMDYIPSLLEELGSTLGQTFNFRAELLAA